MRIRLILPASLLLVTCAAPESDADPAARIESESQAARIEFDRIQANHARWFAAGQIDSIAATMTEDHASMPPNLPPISGRANWIAWIQSLAAQGALSVENVTESVVANGPIAVHRGRFTLSLAPGPNAPAGVVAVTDTGKFLWHWRKINGQWLLAAAIWNNNAPPK